MIKRVAISLPGDLLSAIDEESRVAGLSRSRMVAVAARHHLANLRRERQISAYVASYQEQPESADEVAGSEAFLRRAFAATP